MPRRLTQTKPNTHQALKNSSYESIVVSWLMQDGWQVFLPVLDHGHQTDILISDGPNYFRIQVKTVGASSDKHEVHNQWKDSNIDCVVFFARNSNWGVVAPAFKEDKRHINHESHIKFEHGKKEFLKAFHKLEVKKL
jgi:hypothetical protein